MFLPNYGLMKETRAQLQLLLSKDLFMVFILIYYI